MDHGRDAEEPQRLEPRWRFGSTKAFAAILRGLFYSLGDLNYERNYLIELSFIQNITKRANETQEALNSMTAQLNETAILVDNITNTSLALANTQFIESRVQEDDIEIEQPAESITKVCLDIVLCNVMTKKLNINFVLFLFAE